MTEPSTRIQRKVARQLEDDFLYCRTVGHRWDRFEVDRSTIKTRWGKPIGFECQGCKMQRIDVINALGQLSWRTYRQPEGYRIPSTRTPKKPALRLELLNRT